ncbi:MULTISPECIES: peptide deformylase [Shewanella]|uniref:Peptide deformylase n=1 Tax=Shewanella insulae TaxID=2681496 RepID=A0A6L7HTL2_9GAMM|nr:MULTISPECIES: peptide deformylase [Shewanella]MCG9712280.1 peptide deformylase [Shewanella insulae]MCG9721152.1 peptide deformylase [Shewanella sp. Isolate7]MCG9756527.1 peptide deformylase [Shewanella insulae]MXR67483.1 peptide deformylase [Shewanella insulae]
MPVLDILTIPDERLKRKAKPVEDIAAVQGFIDDLIETMYHTDDGIGLAATQVGSEHAILVIDLSEERDQPMVVINPEFVERSGEIVGEEGCLSIPGYRAKVTRFEKVKVKALNRQGEAFEIESDDFLAIVLQHEMDHLDGKVFIEHLSPLKQQIALKKVKKYR